MNETIKALLKGMAVAISFFMFMVIGLLAMNLLWKIK